MSEIPATPASDPLGNDHYLRAVTAMAQTHEVVAHGAIYSESGIKLIDKGTRIDGRLHERLVRHKLREPVDAHLTVANAVTPAALLAQAEQLLQTAWLPQLLAQALGGSARLLAPLKALSLTPGIAFKLTVMREQMPDLLVHSLEVMLTAQYLALASQMPEAACNRLAVAALLHDLGVLHMDPVWRDPNHQVTGTERSHLVVHPITAMMMVRDAGVYGRAVETAVLEHHERMDGTGYPRGLAGDQISALGQVLLLAEVVAAIAEKYAHDAVSQLSLVLRLNRRKFPPQLTQHTLALLNGADDADSTPTAPPKEQLQALIHQLQQAFDQWQAAKAACHLPDDLAQHSGPMAFVQERLRSLEHTLIGAGMRSGDLEHLQDDAVGLSELSFVVREALWQLTSIVNGCERRWPTELQAQTDPQAVAAAQWCQWVRDMARAA